MKTEKFTHLSITFNVLYFYSKLNKAVDCFKEYREACVNEYQYHSTAKFYDQMSEGPLGLTMELCKNPKFKQGEIILKAFNINNQI